MTLSLPQIVDSLDEGVDRPQYSRHDERRMGDSLTWRITIEANRLLYSIAKEARDGSCKVAEAGVNFRDTVRMVDPEAMEGMAQGLMQHASTGKQRTR